jgi:membrane associated rhomboid family serine protease
MIQVFRKSKSFVASARKQSVMRSLPNDQRLIFGIIGTNVAVFGAWYQSQNDYAISRFLRDNFTVSHQGVLRQYKIHTLVTAMFSHMELSHLALNMITLYFFGTQALAVLGARSFMSLYFGGGLTASCCHVFWPDVAPASWTRRLRGSMYAPALGASGAVSAVVAWSIFYAPLSIVYVYMVIPVPAALFGIFYIGSEFQDLYKGNTMAGNAAHLGGAAFGASYFLLRNSRRFLRR